MSKGTYGHIVEHEAAIAQAGLNAAEIDGFTGIGLKNINTRIQYLKGTVHFDTAPNKGTAVNIMVPLS